MICVQMCIMAGCDFVKALPGVGIKKAHGHMRKLKSSERVGPAESTPDLQHTGHQPQQLSRRLHQQAQYARRQVAHEWKPGAGNVVCLSCGPEPLPYSTSMCDPVLLHGCEPSTFNIVHE